MKRKVIFVYGKQTLSITCIWEVFGSHLRHDTVYIDRFTKYFSICPDNYRIISPIGKTAFFVKIISNPSFDNCCIVDTKYSEIQTAV